MKSPIRSTLCSLALILNLAGHPVRATAEVGAGPQETGGGIAVARSINEFGLALHRELAARGENLFFSPASLVTALAMTYAGARGTTAEQMRETLRFTVPDEVLHREIGQWLDGVVAGRDGCELSIANALWGQQGDTFLESFLELMTGHYGAGLRRVDFRNAAEVARLTINAWVEEQTRQRIRDLIPPGILDSGTSLVLTNAIHFKGTWVLQFDPEQTRDAPFHLEGGATREVPMMELRGSTFGYLQGEKLQAIELPYVGDRLSMVILLPSPGTSLQAFEEELEADALEEWLEALQPRRLALVAIPRFELTSTHRLAEVLPKMGMPAAFGESADFSGMTGRRELFISEVLHKAFVKVDEEGTEAAAATAVVMTRSSSREVFRADRPFVFLIRDRTSGAVLFLGRFASP